MDRFAALLLMLTLSLTLLLIFLALFARSPIFSSLITALLYTLYLFVANEKAGVHNAQEFENRFWTVFALMVSTTALFAADSPVAIGLWSPSLGFLGVITFGYIVHAYDRYLHRASLSRHPNIRRSSSVQARSIGSLSGDDADARETFERHLLTVNEALAAIDQVFVPSTINNMINQNFIAEKSRIIIGVFQEASPEALNYLVTRVKLALLFYKVKDHRSPAAQFRTELVDLLAVNRISVLTIVSKATVLDALQMMKMTANSRCEFWVKNLIKSCTQDDLSELKVLTDAKGDYFSMHKLIYDDIRSPSIRSDILTHIKDQARIQSAHMRIIKGRRSKQRGAKAWRKVLSDVDDTMLCSGAHYPAGIDNRYAKKTLYPGVLAFYRELDLGTKGPNEWPKGRVGNLVFLSARPHMYKDVSEKANYAKFKKLRDRGMHTNPSLLAGDMKSGSEYMLNNNMEPLAVKKFENFKEYVSIYPEFTHVFVGDNGQGDVRGAEMMKEAFGDRLEMVYCHRVQPLDKTHGWDPERYRKGGVEVCFFRTYVEAGIDAAKRGLIRVQGLRRICLDAVKDFHDIGRKAWPSKQHLHSRRAELNHSLRMANEYLVENEIKPVPMILSSPRYNVGERVSTTYGNGWVRSFDPVADLYKVDVDWRGLDVQIKEYKEEKEGMSSVADNDTTQASVDVSRVKSDESNTDEPSQPPAPSGDMSVRSISPPPSSIAHDNDSTSAPDSELAFYRNVASLDADAQVKTFLENEAAKISPQPSPRMSPRFSPLSTATTPNISVSFPGRAGSGMAGAMPSLLLEPTAFDNASATSTSLAAAVSASAKKANSQVYAWVKARDIRPFELPVLMDETDIPSRGMFSFFAATSGSKQAPAVKVDGTIKQGMYVKCFAGEGKVMEVRDDGMVVVTMASFGAKAYLRVADVEEVVKESWLSGLRGRGKTEKQVVDEEEHIFVPGDEFGTPYGDGVVLDVRVESIEDEEDSAVANDKNITAAGGGNVVATAAKSRTTLKVNLGFGVMYCTQTNASAWSKKYARNQSRILSVIGSVFRRMTVAPPRVKKEEDPVVFERVFQDGAIVDVGTFGAGTIKGHRSSDGVYSVDLGYGLGYFGASSLSKHVKRGCSEGCRVVTSLGLTGTLVSVDAATSIHKVVCAKAGLTCYLHPTSIVSCINAAEGEEVITPWVGEGIVERYRHSDKMYEIKLPWGAKLYCPEPDVVLLEINRESGGGIAGWRILRGWFTSTGKTETPARRRSRTTSLGGSVQIKKEVNS
mmetsp:Transcript_25958/g.54032  ORF Transcript_25958/g.54032 Transcript_25958/m.54032 type:complete len:1266 (-) Transcript_25958:28-3825(-)